MRPGGVIADVMGALEAAEKIVHPWVQDALAGLVGGQVAFGSVGRVVAPVNQHVIPCLHAVRLSLFGGIPGIGCFTLLIKGHHDAPVAIALVYDEIARLKPWAFVVKKFLWGDHRVSVLTVSGYQPRKDCGVVHMRRVSG